MSAKKNGANGANAAEVAATEPDDNTAQTKFSADEKRELCRKYFNIDDQISTLEAKIDDLKKKKWEIGFELKQAFGNSKFEYSGKPGITYRVTQYSDNEKGTKIFYLKNVSIDVTERI